MPDSQRRALAPEPDPEFDSPFRVALAEQGRDTMAFVAGALERGDVELWFQPVVSARRPSRIAFHEALVRLRDETGRIIPARDFMDRIEDSELGRRIDCAALSHALDELAAVPGLRLSVNMSARSIGYPDWREVLDRGLRAHPALAERLILEIGEESVLLLPEVLGSFMRRWQGQGVAFALDRFGSGAFALRHLRGLPFDAAKIDASYTRGIALNADNQALVRALAAAAREFGMFAVGQGVETAAEARSLAEIGLDLLQGYRFGLPSSRPPWRSQSDAADGAGAPARSLRRRD